MESVQYFGQFQHTRWIVGDIIIPSVLFSTLGGGGGEILPALQGYYQCIWGCKIDHKLHHSIDNIITVLMISFYSTDGIIHLSLLLGSIVPMEVLLDFQDGSILELGGFEIEIRQDYLRSDI